jgi:hypothetical protein
MRSLAVTDENFENQRQTVMEERRQRIDNSPYGHAFIRIGEISFKSWSYSHPVIGYWEDLEAAGLDDVQAFHSRWYRPDNAVLAIAGDFDPDEALAIAGDYFGDIAAARNRAALRLGQRSGLVRESLSDPLANLPAILVNHPAPTHDDPTFYVYGRSRRSSSAGRRAAPTAGSCSRSAARSGERRLRGYRGPSLFSCSPSVRRVGHVAVRNRYRRARGLPTSCPRNGLTIAQPAQGRQGFRPGGAQSRAHARAVDALPRRRELEERYLERRRGDPADIRPSRGRTAESARVELRVQPA